MSNTETARALDNEFQRAQFKDLGSERPEAGISEQQLDVIRNIPVTLSMEIGRTMLNIRNLLELTPGSVVKLERPVGEPLDILVNGCLIARGEVVVVNEKFGMRITDIVSPEERVKKLR
jgi:flagellar motor switch protein FliN/FliY